MVEPMYSPWGTVDHCKMLCYGAFEVQTARHGGVMIMRELVGRAARLTKQQHCVAFATIRIYTTHCSAITKQFHIVSAKCIHQPHTRMKPVKTA